MKVQNPKYETSELEKPWTNQSTRSKKKIEKPWGFWQKNWAIENSLKVLLNKCLLPYGNASTKGKVEDRQKSKTWKSPTFRIEWEQICKKRTIYENISWIVLKFPADVWLGKAPVRFFKQQAVNVIHKCRNRSPPEP